MKKYFISFFVVTALSVFAPQYAHAHEYASDSETLNGVVVHIAPADDPVAGEASTIFITLSEVNNLEDGYEISAKFTQPNEEEITIYPVGVGDTVKINYTFPERGNYELSLYVVKKGDVRSSPIIVRQQIVVSRDTRVPTTLNNSAAIYVSGLLVVCSGVLLVVMWSRRKDIMQTVRNDSLTK